MTLKEVYNMVWRYFYLKPNSHTPTDLLYSRLLLPDPLIYSTQIYFYLTSKIRFQTNLISICASDYITNIT